MAMLDHAFAVYRGNLAIAQMLVADVTDAQMVQPPLPRMNHAAWILGHLTMPRLWLKEELQLAANVPAHWPELFMPGSTPVADAAKYPSKAELLAAPQETHVLLEAGLRKLPEAVWSQPQENERLRRLFPLKGDSLLGLITTHESFHIGQLSAWRRAMGMKPAF